jgi:hypothetical protein
MRGRSNGEERKKYGKDGSWVGGVGGPRKPAWAEYSKVLTCNFSPGYRVFTQF